jgi:hypothetical protein
MLIPSENFRKSSRLNQRLPPKMDFYQKLEVWLAKNQESQVLSIKVSAVNFLNPLSASQNLTFTRQILAGEKSQAGNF